jgi:hypothetical protein
VNNEKAQNFSERDEVETIKESNKDSSFKKIPAIL